MQQFRHIIIAALLVASSAHGAQSLVANGSLTSAIDNDGAPTGWQVIEGSPDVMDANSNSGLANTQRFGAAPDASPDGGTWVGIARNASYIERFGQTLSGLTIGQRYDVSWLDGNFGYSYGTVNYLGSNAVAVLMDDVVLGSGQTHALGSQWFKESLSFVATAATQTLSFKLAADTKAYMSVDGVAVTMSTTAVPEPGAMGLMGLGLAGVMLAVRRRQA
jgi:hypothetical protein